METVAEKLTAIKRLADEAQALLPAPDTIIPVNAGATLQTVIDRAPDHAVLALETGTYVGTLTTPRPITMMTRRQLEMGRAVDADVTILGWEQAVRVLGRDVSFHGIEFLSHSSSHNLVEVTGADFLADRCVAFGSLVTGAHRGMLLNGDGALVLSSAIDECWLSGQEAQAISCNNGSKHIVIDDCYLGGGSQSFLSGGADSASPDMVPMDITISRSTLAKRPEWIAKGAMIKTALETKAVIGLHVLDCTFQGAGTAGSQGAYLIVLKSANQDGHAPWSVTTGVLIERCTAQDGGGCVSFVGQDGTNPAGKMSNITLRNLRFANIDGSVGRGRGFEFHSAPTDVTVQNVTAEMRNMQAEMYFNDTPPKRLVLQNIKGILPKTSVYGIKIDGAGSTPLQTWAPDAVVQITATDTGWGGV